MPRLLLPVLCLLLAACAGRAPLPTAAPTLDWPLQMHVQSQQQDWLLVVQQEVAALRWSLFDPLGIPQARQRLSGQQWQNDGLLPPNPQMRELFAALLFALTPTAELTQRYPAARWRADTTQRELRDGERQWQVRYRGPLDFDLTANGLNYRVSALPAERGDAR